MKKNNTIEFNNFKCFGEKMQKFSSKPITLIYGPNSVGKSSVIHSQIFADYALFTGQHALKRAYFVGDMLDIGDFNTLVHKQEKDRVMTYTLTYTKEDDFKRFTPLYTKAIEFKEKGLFDIDNIIEEFQKRLLSVPYQVKKDCLYVPTNTICSLRLSVYEKKSPFIEEEYIDAYNHFCKINRTNLPKDKKSRQKIFRQIIDNGPDYETDPTKYIERIDNKPFDIIDEFVLIYRDLINTKIDMLYCDQSAFELGLILIVDKILKDEKIDSFNEALLLKDVNTDNISQEDIELEEKDLQFFYKSLLEEYAKDKNSHKHLLAMRKDSLEYLSSAEKRKFARQNDIIIDIKDPRHNSLREHTLHIAKEMEIILQTFINIRKIKKITIDLKLSLNKEKININYNCHINDELFFHTEKDNLAFNNQSNTLKSLTIPETCITYGHKREISPFTYINKHGVFSRLDIFSEKLISLWAESIKESLLFTNHIPTIIADNILETIQKDGTTNKLIQYIGPLRYYPERKDIEDIPIYKKKILRKEKTKFNPKKMRILAKINSYSPKIIFAFAFFILYPKDLYRLMQDYLNATGSFNLFRRKVNQKSINGSLNDIQMWQKIANSENMQKSINAWLSNDDKLKSTYTLQVDKIKERFWGESLKINFIDNRTGTKVTPRDMGLGITQVLPILLSCYGHKDAKVLIEQPELHLHPAVQCELADEFIKSAKNNNNHFMIESHSEHLLLRIMRRMRETADGTIDPNDELALTPDDICLLYVDNNERQTYITEMELDEDGTLLDPWPNGFFEEGHKERFA